MDWAESHHDVALADEEGTVVARVRIETDTDGFTELLALIAQHGGSPQETPVAIETDKNLLVVALARAGFTMYPINPRAVARYRERYSQSGRKSDAGDAALLADVLRTDRHQHRALPAISDDALAVKALARQHQEAIWALHQTTSRLRSVPLEFYPQALQAFPNLGHQAALSILAAAPTPTKGHRLTPKRIVALLHRCGRRNDPTLVESILKALRKPALNQSGPVEAALGVSVATLIGILVSMHAAVCALEQALAAQFDPHPLAPVLRSVPGLGPVLAARILAEVGDDPARFTNPGGLRSFAGTAPVTRASGRSRYVKARKVRNKRLADACHWWAFSTLTKSAGARAHYDRRRAAGDHHNAALRNLANKLLGRLWWCLKNNQPWDEQNAWPAAPTPAVTVAA
jgi:transposase